jgi:hypothetical protein
MPLALRALTLVPRALVQVIAGLALLCLAAVPAEGATLKARSDADEIAAADRIIRGRVESVRTERRPDTGVIDTIARVRVVDDYTGGTDRVLEIREIGGTVGDTTLTVPGAARFIPGDDILALVERTASGWRPSAMSRSVYGVRDTPGGTELVRQEAGAQVVGGDPGPSRRRLSEFAAQIRSVKRRGAVRLSSPGDDLPVTGALEVTSPAVASFRLLGTMRWHEADTGATVLFYRNTVTAPPLDSGNSEAELQLAVQAWTAPTGASLSLAYGGTRSVPGALLLACSPPPTPGGALVTYEDPEDHITTSGVIAIGGACSTTSSTRLVNGTMFSKITYGFVIFTTKAEMPQLGTSLFFSRVATHEVGHAIGLGHTPTDGSVASATSNIMYPACCFASLPVPPAIGPDDLAGLEFIYPAGGSGGETGSCTYDVSPASQQVAPGGGGLVPLTVNTGPACTWSISTPPAWLSLIGPATRTGAGTVSMVASANTGAPRSTSITVASIPVTVTQGSVSPLDTDNDGLPDAWEIQAGLNPSIGTGADGATGDPDGDGLTNLQEYQQRLHPRGVVQRYLAEGAQSDFFSTRIAIVNPSATTTAYVQLRFAGPPDATGAVVTREHWLTLGPHRRATVDAAMIAGLTGSFATTIESNTPVVADRTVSWDSSGYGSHAESATEAPRTT